MNVENLIVNISTRPDEIYHVTVMPCYDKKLEASRDDFVFQVETQEETSPNEGLWITEVDSVLTTGEVLDLIQVRLGFHCCNFYEHYCCLPHYMIFKVA